MKYLVITLLSIFTFTAHGAYFDSLKGVYTGKTGFWGSECLVTINTRGTDIFIEIDTNKRIVLDGISSEYASKSISRYSQIIVKRPSTYTELHASFDIGEQGLQAIEIKHYRTYDVKELEDTHSCRKLTRI